MSVTDALNHTTNYTYDNNGNLAAVTDARGKTTTLSYDNNNRLVEETDPLDRTRRYEYDPAGNLAARTNPDSTEINYTYDANSRLIRIDYPDSGEITFSYDFNGNRASMNDPLGNTSYSYDNLNRLTSVTRDADTISYGYDSAGNITTLTYPDGLQATYTYNGLNLPVSVSDSVYSAEISYDEAGNRIRENLPNGIDVNYTYDLGGRLTEVEHVYGEDAIARSAYTLDNTGNRLSATDALDQTTNYTYDDLYQLTRVDYPNSESVEYTYDPAGNRLNAGGVQYIYDDANRLIQAGAAPYSYDLNGNLISVGDAVYYDYDYENRLISYTNANKTIQYTYDGDGNRLSQSVSGSVYADYEYIYDINTGIPRLLVEKDGTRNENNYLYAGRLLSRISPEGMVYYHQDGLGSISVISDVYGNPLNRYTYDAFGSPRSVSESVCNPFRFTGEPYDASGLIYLRARYYDPATGRFLSRDTFSGTLNNPLSQNRYVYCSNNPVIYIDPTGYLAICDYNNGLITFDQLVEQLGAIEVYDRQQLVDLELVNLLARTIYGEQTDDIDYGQEQVAWTIINRVLSDSLEYVKDNGNEYQVNLYNVITKPSAYTALEQEQDNWQSYSSKSKEDPGWINAVELSVEMINVLEKDNGQRSDDMTIILDRIILQGRISNYIGKACYYRADYDFYPNFIKAGFNSGVYKNTDVIDVQDYGGNVFFNYK